ncbi:MAG: twin-arginine translocase TatA/TatE family subunit [Armatimonadetes bacterium]|nr:twin-arginine translocase TatA/TatE family subunit [Armatimonadota bacterium]
MLGPSELWPIAVIVLVLFGAQRLPAMARSMGEGIKEFKKGIREADLEDEPKPAVEKPVE